ncbi:hypothetical protein [Flagellimonas eckloniae]|uniref:Ig-like domain-containing protein n=1 Tax=Flagellimonas eckloniae TaxID=346185 RepID=A0A0Q0XQS9_9FLAO|nr:hypothetical protein [Allomuricauda eckloniae]KQC31525.1 hypothetical protein AAY42_17840 [Allomuricauda eckloniae]
MDNHLCIGETYELDATSTGALSYQWYRNNQRLPQFDDTPVINISQDGTYDVIVDFFINLLLFWND